MSTSGDGTVLSVGWPRDNEEFLRGLFGDERWKRVHVCSVAGDPGLGSSVGWGGGLAGVRLAGMGMGTNNYYAVSLFSGRSRVLPAFEELVVLGIDDVVEKIDPTDVLALLGEPTYRLATSPGSQQWGYRLAEGVRSAREATALVHAVRVRLTGVDGDDPGMEGVTRYLRLPFGSNTKAKYGPGGYRLKGLASGGLVS